MLSHQYSCYQVVSLLERRFLVFILLLFVVQISNAFTLVTYVTVSRQLSSTNTAISSSVNDASDGISVGFIGCGTIAKAIATGLATQNSVNIASTSVSRRSTNKSKALEESFPDLVNVYDDNQEILQVADMIFITVLPQQMSSVLQALTFDESRHLLVSLVSTSTLEGLASDSRLPLDKVSKVICLPSVATHQGVSLVVPEQQSHNPILLEMLNSLGGYVECQTQDSMNAMMVTSGLMGSLYGILRNNRDWLVEKGVSQTDASYFVARLYFGMMQDAVKDCDDPHRLDDLIQEQTPGGLNEQALNNLEKLGVMKDYDTVMEALLSRLQGTSDGSLPEEE